MTFCNMPYYDHATDDFKTCNTVAEYAIERNDAPGIRIADRCERHAHEIIRVSVAINGEPSPYRMVRYSGIA